MLGGQEEPEVILERHRLSLPGGLQIELQSVVRPIPSDFGWFSERRWISGQQFCECLVMEAVEVRTIIESGFRRHLHHYRDDGLEPHRPLRSRSQNGRVPVDIFPIVGEGF